MSMGSVGDLIKGTMKKFGSMDIMDAEVSLNRHVTWIRLSLRAF